MVTTAVDFPHYKVCVMLKSIMSKCSGQTEVMHRSNLKSVYSQTCNLWSSYSLGGTLTKCIERCCHKHSSCPPVELNGVPLYSLVWVACKPPAVALHEAASLSGILVWTGHNCRLCCQEKGWLEVPVFSVCLFFLLLLWKTTKMENNRRVISASLCDLDKERSSGSQTSKAVFRT